MKNQTLEKYLFLFSWVSGILVSLTIGYAVLFGPINLPEIFGAHIFSNLIGWTIIITTILSMILIFFRK